MFSSKRSLELFYVDGRPDGLLVAEIFDWTGHVLIVPRLRLREALLRSEMKHAGVYLLLGENRQGKPLAYIGEAENLSKRLAQHARSETKQWWDKAVLVTTTNNQLHKAYGHYLEARLIQQALKVQHTPLENSTSPSLPALREAECANMEGFLNNLFLVLPALRVDMFIENARPAGSTRSDKEGNSSDRSEYVQFELVYKKYNIHAYATLQNAHFVVEAGSEAFPLWKGGKGSAYSDRHEELFRSGVLEHAGDKAVFVKDYVCSSPSEAAAIIQGRSANGPLVWRLKDSVISYKKWELDRLQDDESII